MSHAKKEVHIVHYKSLLFVWFCIIIIFLFSANANLNYDGFSGGVNTPFGGVSGNIGVGSGLQNNNLLMAVVVGLGVLSLINILATVIVPWLSNLGDDDDDADDQEDGVQKGRRYQRNINMAADYVLNAIEGFAKKHE